jgi:hypothetical protein
MRLWFICRECAIHYLPPESMRYETAGEDASPLWCSVCQTVMRELGIPEPEHEAAVALTMAKLAAGARAPQADQERRPDVRPSRPARTRRARSGPTGMRSKFH